MKKSGSGTYVGAIAACVAGGALAFLVFSRVGSKPTGSPASGGEAVSPAATTGAWSGRSVAPTETVNVEDLPMAPPDAGDVQAGAAGGRHPSKRFRAAPKAKEPAPAAPNCNPPFIIDGLGIKRPKPGCL